MPQLLRVSLGGNEERLRPSDLRKYIKCIFGGDAQKREEDFEKRLPCPAPTFKSEQIAHSLSTYPLLCQAAVALKDPAFPKHGLGRFDFPSLTWLLKHSAGL